MAKKNSRRTFIELGVKTGMALPLLSSGLVSCSTDSEEKSTDQDSSSKKLNILILGGTSFLGPHQIAYALGRGHNITTFTRGKTLPTIHQDLFANVEQLIGDRNDNLTALENRKWDAVIDNSGRKVEWTQASASLLKDSCDLYVYTSSTGVFYPYINSTFEETSEVLLELPEGIAEDEKLEYEYGVMKANSEQEAIQQFGEDRAIIVRPTYMLGPADRTNRSIYWPMRLSKGGETMIPGMANDPVQYLDVRDVAEWMIRLIEEKKAGTYNAVGPEEAQNIASFVAEAQQAFEVESSFVQIDDYDFLKENKVYYIVPWIMPDGKNAGTALIKNAKAKENGLTFRPLTQTTKDILDWWNSDAVSQERKDKYASNPNSIMAREAAIIQQWKSL